jgi:NAD(P)-dependent dehydrogenase (short-subunit alcohol dehydrogenase family)
MAHNGIAGKVVLITGAASGLGAATAVRLHAMGAKLALSDIDAGLLAAQVRELGGDALALPADVRDFGAMQDAAMRTTQHFGGIDVVWANAGIASFGTLASTDPAAWAGTVEVNLIGAFHTVRAALPQVLARRGHVAVTASLASFVNGPCMSAYAATKAGVEAMCNALRIEVAHHGVTVGAIHPSWVATPMVSDGEQFQSFRLLRSAMPAPLRRDMPVAEAAELIARAIAERRDRAYLPRFIGLLRWLRAPLHTTLGERDMRRVMPALEQAYAADVAAGGLRGASLAPRVAALLHQPGPR